MRAIAGLTIGHVVDVLRAMPERSVNAVVTSPPYFNLRDYGVPPATWPEVRYVPLAGLGPLTVPAMTACLGLEPTVDAYIGHLVLVFRELRRVLADDGGCWLNLGDTFGGGMTGGTAGLEGSHKQASRMFDARPEIAHINGLLGVPWRAAFALQADGWHLRSEVIWHKPNPMPESVKNRPTKAHEHVFLLAKQANYWYDADAVKERSVTPFSRRQNRDQGTRGKQGYSAASGKGGNAQRDTSGGMGFANGSYRNRRSVWTIHTAPFGGDHFAPFPPELARVCVRSLCPPGGTVLDPFFGTGTVAVVAEQEGRQWRGIDLDPAAVDHIYRRVYEVQKKAQ